MANVAPSVQTAVTPPRPLRILMIAPTSFFSDYGGHIRILEETRALQNLGHQVAIVTYYKGSDMPGLDIRRTRPLPWRTNYEVGSSRHKLVFDLYLLAQALREGFRFRPDVIHGHMHEGALIGGLLAKLLRVPLVFDFQGSLTAEMVDHHFLRRDGRVYKWALALEKAINRLPAAILTSSSQATTLLQEQFGIADAALHPLPDCADTVRFDPALFPPAIKQQLKTALGLPLDRPIIAYLGLLTDYQGIPHLLQTAVRLKKWGKPAHFLIMGYPNVDHYRQMAHNFGVADWVTFTGKVEYRVAPSFLALGDIAVAPKMSATEGSGKVLNYMALAQPIVAYDSPVHREYLADLGLFVPSGDIDGFAQTVANLMDDLAGQAQLGQQLRQRALTQFSWQRAGETIVDVYTAVLAARST